jgi:hypothetical protein
LEDYYELSSSQPVILGNVLGKRLACCPHCRKVLWSRASSPDIFHSTNICDLTKVHCPFRGRRLKFSSYGIDSLRVCWVCPNIVDLSFLRGDAHG